MVDVEDWEPVDSGDVEQAVAAAVSAMSRGTEADWSVLAGDLRWTCRATVEHVADDLVAYGALLTEGAIDSYPPFEVVLAADADPAGMLRVLRATGGLLAAAVRTAALDAEVWHPSGMADREAVAAMGVVEVLVHTHDICRGLRLPWQPPPGLSGRVLGRLFSHVERDGEAGAGEWATLLWATGRRELPGRPRLREWRWFNQRP